MASDGTANGGGSQASRQARRPNKVGCDDAWHLIAGDNSALGPGASMRVQATSEPKPKASIGS